MIQYVGQTPMVKIPQPDGINVFCKCEFMNPSGSIKDRLAARILTEAEHRGLIHPGDTLIEATSGNTGISLAMFCAQLKYKLKIVMPSNMSEERKRMFKMYGAELIEVGPGDFEGAIALRDQLSQEHGWFNCNQFHTQWNIDAHFHTTGPEIRDWLDDAGVIPEALVLGTGTGGTLMGAGSYLKDYFEDLELVAVEPAESAVMSGGEPGIHGIQGIGDGSKYLVDLEQVNAIEVISTADATEQALQLARLGYFVGISAGANFLAAIRYAKRKGMINVLTVLCDRGDRYLSCI